MKEREREREEKKVDLENVLTFRREIGTSGVKSSILILLSKQVRTTELGWRETRKQLRKDHRWDLTEQLDKEEKEKLFDSHIEGLTKRNKDMFHKLLDETEVKNMSWNLLLVT